MKVEFIRLEKVYVSDHLNARERSQTNTIIEGCRQTFEVTRVYSRKHRDKLREDLVENVGDSNAKIERVLITLRLDQLQF